MLRALSLAPRLRLGARTATHRRSNARRFGSLRGELFRRCARRCGDSAVCVVGESDRTLGSCAAFARDVRVEANSVSECGVYGKQSAAVFIAIASRVYAPARFPYARARTHTHKHARTHTHKSKRTQE